MRKVIGVGSSSASSSSAAARNQRGVCAAKLGPRIAPPST
jgi:hypothetical protein